jgi:hypothetical protein
MLQELITQLEAHFAEEKEYNDTGKSLQFIGDQRYNEGWETGYAEVLDALKQYASQNA